MAERKDTSGGIDELAEPDLEKTPGCGMRALRADHYTRTTTNQRVQIHRREWTVQAVSRSQQLGAVTSKPSATRPTARCGAAVCRLGILLP